jgi:hypothetical protein
MVFGRQPFRHDGRGTDFRIIRPAPRREREQGLIGPELAAGERRDDGIDAATERDTDALRPQGPAARGGHETFRDAGRRRWEIVRPELESQARLSADDHAGWLGDVDQVPGRHAAYAPQQRAIHRQMLVLLQSLHHLRIAFGGHAFRDEQRLVLGREECGSVGHETEVQRMHTRAVAAEQHLALARVVDRDGELAVHAIEEAIAPLQVQREQAACGGGVVAFRLSVYPVDGTVEDQCDSGFACDPIVGLRREHGQQTVLAELRMREMAATVGQPRMDARQRSGRCTSPAK